MYSKLGKGYAWLLTLLGWMLFSFSTSAQQTQLNEKKPLVAEVDFSAKPASCVALHQGRKCYALVSLNWQVREIGDFCIYEKATNKVLQCWKNSQGNTMKVEFESSGKIEYQLVAIDSNIVIAETAIDVSWVHKASPRKRRWRLF